ncbi:hypothetical protein OIDMADRAFT_23454 [Oidiodendron maius Zn]|uniref:C2H2-type domain-containing protein n=1 Tax=Oidiodendron maius (strain Zn) TaxID=913774 RepID=A0A0C3I2P3_OIDMZ|nr:hypothetical protein OIDMADRAFT_23454 [Oidiodendron maius Zn]
MAHQTPQYPSGRDIDHLSDIVMIELPFCGLFSGRTKRNDASTNDVMDAITFRSTTAGPRKNRARGAMRDIIDNLYDVLDSISLVEKFREEIENMRDHPPDIEMNDEERENLKLQDAVKLAGRIITYWEEEWMADTPQAEQDRPAMETAAQLMSDMTEGIHDQVSESFDRVSKVSLQRVRIWLQMGGFDKNAPYRECYETEVANEDGADDKGRSGGQGDQHPRFSCNQCSEVFEQAVQLDEHLRQNHGGHRVSNWLTSTLKQRVIGGLARRIGMKGKVENNHMEEGTDTRAEVNKAEPTPTLPHLRESWLDIARLSDPIVQPVQCPRCPKTYTSLTALRNHRQTEHNEVPEAKVIAGPEALNLGVNDGTDSGTDA